MREVGVKFGIVAPFERPTTSRGAESFSQIVTYLSRLDDHFDSVWVPDHLVPFTPGFLEVSLNVQPLSVTFQPSSRSTASEALFYATHFETQH